uniref:Uncharacterized protein n=1 Tax=Physcomitrium patens TaxID=3218 RepID=A0A7I3YXV6_PHYPA
MKVGMKDTGSLSLLLSRVRCVFFITFTFWVIFGRRISHDGKLAALWGRSMSHFQTSRLPSSKTEPSSCALQALERPCAGLS